MRDQDKSLAPNLCCVTGGRRLAEWAKGSRCMPFAILMVCREPTDRVSDCYFCLSSVTGVTTKSKHAVQYPAVPSAMRPVPHSAELPVPKPPTNMTLSDSQVMKMLAKLTTIWIVIQHLQGPVLPMNHTC